METKHYTWEEKIDSLVKLAKRVDTFFSSREGVNSLDKIPGLFLVRLASDDVGAWWHDEPNVVDEIKAVLLGRPKEYTDELTGIRMMIDYDSENPDHPIISVICPEYRTLSTEQINDALHRLRSRARISSAQFPDLILKESSQ